MVTDMARRSFTPTGAPVTSVTSLETRGRIAGAAFDLFAARGYEGTTVDAIAERAGIARRTFFRYFRSKDDVIFPDHDTLLETVDRYLETATGVPPVEAVCGAVRLVFQGYLSEQQVAVRRYRLTRSVVALRDREIASVHRYERTLGRYLRARLGTVHPETEAVLRADVIAAAVVAAHNAVLREWLRAGGEMDPLPALDSACAWVIRTYAQPPMPAAAAADQPADQAGDVVVAVFRAGQPIDDVVQRITRSL